MKAEPKEFTTKISWKLGSNVFASLEGKILLIKLEIMGNGV